MIQLCVCQKNIFDVQGKLEYEFPKLFECSQINSLKGNSGKSYVRLITDENL